MARPGRLVATAGTERTAVADSPLTEEFVEMSIDCFGALVYMF